MQTEKMEPLPSCPTFINGKLNGVFMHYYQFNIADYRKDTAHLASIEHYIYRTLIDWYYLDEKPIPNETQLVLRRLCLGSDHVENLLNVLNDFFKLTENGWEQSRIEQEIAIYHANADKNRRNGALGGRPKKINDLDNLEKPNKTQSVILANPSETQINPNQELITNNHKPLEKHTRKNALDFTPEFLEFWLAYPKKTGKDEAFKSWNKKKPRIDDVMFALSWQVNSSQWQKGFIPNPATYINQGRWQDEQPAEVAPF
jgi:uncharacterized protein YdaU (DUF1376 family)